MRKKIITVLMLVAICAFFVYIEIMHKKELGIETTIEFEASNTDVTILSVLCEEESDGKTKYNEEEYDYSNNILKLSKKCKEEDENIRYKIKMVVYGKETEVYFRFERNNCLEYTVWWSEVKVNIIDGEEVTFKVVGVNHEYANSQVQDGKNVIRIREKESSRHMYW